MQASKSKHPTYNNKPVPTFQLLSKLAKFQGERKDIVGKTPQEILNSTNAAMSSMNQVRNEFIVIIIYHLINIVRANFNISIR